jgi:outer membrane protein assembly factor BamB
VGGAWPQLGFGPGHAGVTSATGVLDDGTAYWHLRRVRSGPPLLADGRLFHFALTGEGHQGTPTLTETPPTGTGHRPEGTLTLFCRDAHDGRRRWVRRLPGRTRSAVVTEGHVLVAGDGYVAAYRTDDGSQIWRAGLGERRAMVDTAVDGTALVSTEFVRGDDRKPDVRAYRVADGTPRWKQPSPRWQADLAATGDTVLSLSAEFQVGSVLTARSLGDGSERWRVEFDDNGIPGGPFAAAGTAYVVPDDGGVHAFDLADGSQRWHYDAETTNRVGVAAGENVAYLVDDGTLRVVDPADGTQRWSATPGTGDDYGYSGRPAVGRDTLYLQRGGYPAHLVALSRIDGSERWSYRLPETVVEGDMVTSGLAAQPVVAEGAVYAYAQDGLYAFGPAEN